MSDLRGRQIDAVEAPSLGAYREIEVLEIDEEALVEAFEGLEQRAAHEQKRAHHLADDARLIMRPVVHEQRRGHAREQAGKARGLAEHQSVGGDPRAAWCELPL